MCGIVHTTSVPLHRHTLPLRACRERATASADTESQARFETGMDRCGVLLICFEGARNLIDLFRRSCPPGVMNWSRRVVPWPVDYIVYESAGPPASPTCSVQRRVPKSARKLRTLDLTARHSSGFLCQ